MNTLVLPYKYWENVVDIILGDIDYDEDYEMYLTGYLSPFDSLQLIIADAMCEYLNNNDDYLDQFSSAYIGSDRVFLSPAQWLQVFERSANTYNSELEKKPENFRNKIKPIIAPKIDQVTDYLQKLRRARWIDAILASNGRVLYGANVVDDKGG